MLAVLLLVVLVVIPWLNVRRLHHSRVICAQQLQSIGVGMMVYVSEHRGYLPTVCENRYGMWDVELVADGYVRGRSVFHCPADRMERGNQPARSYSFADAIGASTRYWIQGSRLPCRYLSSSNTIALVVEQVSPGNVFGKILGAEAWSILDVKSQHEVRQARETCASANCLFLDGHVAWFDNPQTNWFPKPPPGAPERPCP